MKKIKIFNTIRKELNKFEVLFDTYADTLEFGDYIKNIKGKMLRPAITIMGARIGGGVTEKSLLAALAIELLHNATLVHDDVIDNAIKRRGKDTFRYLHGNKQAILYGDYLLAKGLECVLKTEQFSIMRTITQTTGEMCIGEIDQLKHSGQFKTAEQDYYDIIYKKTASLFVCSLLVGYYSSGNNELEEIIKEIGYNIGMAFQINDDLLDYDTSGSSGKDFGNDIREQKMTLPLIYALENASQQEKDEILALLKLPSISEADILCIIDFINVKGGIAYTKDVLSRYIDKANEAIDSIPEENNREELNNLCQYLSKRIN